MVDERQPNIAHSRVAGTDAMAIEAKIDRAENRKTFLKRAKKSIKVIGWEFRPYYTRPKKRHLCKLIIVMESPLRHQVFRRVRAQNVLMKECLDLVQIKDKETIKKIHAERGKKINYGFKSHQPKE